MKKLAILGSTGSIGRQALDVVKGLEDVYSVECIAAFSNAALLAAQADEFKPKYAGLINNAGAAGIYCGADAYDKVLNFDVDVLLAASGGIKALPVVLKALERGITVALANKETLVAGGELISRLPADKRKKLIPVDSEHSAIFQCLNNNLKDVRRLILTASGGAFFGKDRNFLKTVTPEQALKHPTWNMGEKITIDSATMMNKGLEIIEARWLFDLPESKIDVIIHPQSIVHSFVEFVDSSVLAQLSNSDMRLPIQYALTYPGRIASPVPPLNLEDKKLEFFALKNDSVKCVTLCRQALNRGGLFPTVLNSANDVCVQKFLQHKIGFCDIESTVENVLNSYAAGNNELTLENIYLTQKDVTAFTEKSIAANKENL